MAAPLEVVKIKSSDGHIFYLDKKCALVSRVIEKMLNTPGSTESETAVIQFRYQPADMLEKCIEYFYYYNRWNGSTGEHPEFQVDPQIALALLSTAAFLET